jgi:translation initiation factor eIF-2B subunit delta
VQTDALVNNELGNPFDLVAADCGSKTKIVHGEKSPLTDWSEGVSPVLNENLTMLNLTYDVTPPEMISCVVTDMGMLPCTSVPVVLRLKNTVGGGVSKRGHQNQQNRHDEDI